MRSACRIDDTEPAKDIVIREIDGLKIPFVSPRLLWKMKVNTHRAKDAPDIVFLRDYFADRGDLGSEVAQQPQRRAGALVAPRRRAGVRRRGGQVDPAPPK